MKRGAAARQQRAAQILARDAECDRLEAAAIGAGQHAAHMVTADDIGHRHALRGTLARICQLLTRRDVALSEVKDGKLARAAPASTIALSGNGLDTSPAEESEDLTSGAGNGANPDLPHRV